MKCFLPSLLFIILCLPFLTSSRPIKHQHAKQLNMAPHETWHHHKHLLDSKRGTQAAGLAELKNYFTQFGYLPKPDRTEPTNLFDHEFESAVALYQTNHGLPVTRRLDSETLTQINSPRCGVPDQSSNEPADRTNSVQRFTFFPGQPRWAVRSKPLTLTYAISTEHTINYLNRSEVSAVFRRAFARWSAVIPVTFKETKDYYTADVKVGFFGGSHGDGEAFDGVLGILGHAFSPESGRLHLDSAERWAVDFGTEGAAVAVDLESVATHEIGHVLGLGHSAVKEAVMYPSLSPRTKKTELRVDDVEGAQALYGSNPNFSISQLVASETSAADTVRPSFIIGGGRRWLAGVLTVVVVVIVGS